MPGVFFQRRHSQQNAHGVIESPSLSTRVAAVNDLQKSLVNFKLRSADRDLDVARNLLQQNIHLIELEDQEVIGLVYDESVWLTHMPSEGGTEQPRRHRVETGEGQVSTQTMDSQYALQTCLQDDIHGDQGQSPCGLM